jgi:hypothetical protein
MNRAAINMDVQVSLLYINLLSFRHMSSFSEGPLSSFSLHTHMCVCTRFDTIYGFQVFTGDIAVYLLLIRKDDYIFYYCGRIH